MWGGTKSDILTSRRGLDEAILEEDMKNQVDSLMEGHEIPGYQLNHNTYVIKAAVSPQCPLGFVHVYVTDMGKIECALRYIFLVFVQYLYNIFPYFLM